jgi:peptidoglycan hydrolase CwlO-like protein
VLTKNIQAQCNELQALIDRYLDDEAFTTYTEALDRKRAERAEEAKAKEKETGRRKALADAAAVAQPPAPARPGTRRCAHPSRVPPGACSGPTGCGASRTSTR